MIPGEIFIKDGDLTLNEGRATLSLYVSPIPATGPVQVGSHYHFFETNHALSFDRDKAAADSGWIFPPARRCVSSRDRTRDVNLVAFWRAARTFTASRAASAAPWETDMRFSD